MKKIDSPMEITSIFNETTRMKLNWPRCSQLSDYQFNRVRGDFKNSCGLKDSLN